MEQTVRVDVRRLDHLMNLIGELVLGKNRLIRIYSDVEERYDGEKFLEGIKPGGLFYFSGNDRLAACGDENTDATSG